MMVCMELIMKHRYDLILLYKEGKVWALIECQGEQHFMPVEEFGGEHKFIINKEMMRKKKVCKGT